MPDRLKKRWQCWKLRWFVRHFRPDICAKHAVQMEDRRNAFDVAQPPCYVCDQCYEERMVKQRKEQDERMAMMAAAELQHRQNTEEILEALKHCKECK